MTEPAGIPPRRVDQYLRALDNGDITIAEIAAVELVGREHEDRELVSQWARQLRRRST
jgi:hypothetical protein